MVNIIEVTVNFFNKFGIYSEKLLVVTDKRSIENYFN
jgi:hypothetical protein